MNFKVAGLLCQALVISRKENPSVSAPCWVKVLAWVMGCVYLEERGFIVGNVHANAGAVPGAQPGLCSTRRFSGSEVAQGRGYLVPSSSLFCSSTHMAQFPPILSLSFSFCS